MTNIRNCPICNSEIEYTNKRSWYNAKKRNSKCKSCQSEQNSKIVHKKMELGWKPHLRNKLNEINKPFHRFCPSCDTKIYHISEKSRDNGIRGKKLCISCATIKYGKTFINNITEEHIKQMRATKAGFSSWDEYVEKYPKKQFYKREVWKYTYRNDLTTLPNFDKRGRNGVVGAYQIDHVVSINDGWEKGIPADEIGKMENLRMITWEENRKKW